MNKRIFLGIAALLSISLLGAACSFPTTPTPFTIPTPNLTMTALFQPTQTIPPSVTPPPVQTATPEPQATLPSPTSPAATGVATAVSTPVGTISGVPDRRSGVSVDAPFLDAAPVIDGDLGEWNLTEQTAFNVVYGFGNHSGQADLSARMMVGWDDDNLYLAAWVVDDTFVQNAVGINLFKGDSLEVLLDTNVQADFYVASLSPDDYQLGVSPGAKAGVSPEAYLWYPRSLRGGRSQVEIAAQEATDGYHVEVAIPWAVFNVTPQSGRHFGFAFSVSDNDSTGTQLQQSMVSNVPTRRLTNPTTWGNLTLTQP